MRTLQLGRKKEFFKGLGLIGHGQLSAVDRQHDVPMSKVNNTVGSETIASRREKLRPSGNYY